MDKRTLVAITFCFLIFLFWQVYFQKPAQKIAPANQIETQTQTIQHKKDIVQKTASKKQPVLQEQNFPTEIGNGTITLTNEFVPFRDWFLSKYKKNTNSDSSKINIQYATNESTLEQVLLGFDSAELLYLQKVKGELHVQNGTAIWDYQDENIKIRRSVQYSSSQHYIDLNYQIEFLGASPKNAYVSIKSGILKDSPENIDQQLVYFAGKEINRIQTESIDPHSNPVGQSLPGPIKWTGSLSRYFILALIPANEIAPAAYLTPLKQGSGMISLAYPIRGNQVNIPLKVYFGPKELEVLRQIEPTLDHSVDFGWFTFLAYPILQVMRWFYYFIHNYGVAIILLTLLLKILTYPLTYKSVKSMAQMAKLQPQIQKIRDKYKDDREALNREMLSLMKGQGYNPMAGCLPILIQMPVFFALYRVLYSAVELYQAPFALWINDLSAKDPYYVTPVLLTITMYIQQKMTPTTTADPVQQKVIQFMPVIFGLFMLTLPSGLTLYMLTNAVASIFQQMILNKKLDIHHVPTVTARAR